MTPLAADIVKGARGEMLALQLGGDAMDDAYTDLGIGRIRSAEWRSGVP